jgi:hypothetical protein
MDQGTDGLSRADHTTGAITGRDIRHWVPLNLGAFQRSPGLSEWLDHSLEGLGFSKLTPEGWFTTGHEFGKHIWAPPPSACDVVVEQLGQARLIRPESAHLIIVPRLMTGRWRRHLGRGSDGYFKIQDSPDIWDMSAQFEPLLIFVCLPFVSFRPALERRKELLDEFQRALPGGDMPPLSPWKRGHLLRKLLGSAREVCPLPGSLVPTVFKTKRQH